MINGKKLFGTDGIRGVANSYPMTSEIAFRVGRATAYLLKKQCVSPRIVIGKDTRLSGYMIESALTSGICSVGVDVLLTGPIPTTAVAFLTQNLKCTAGMVISASHNPAEDNGIKIFGQAGLKLSDELELEIEKYVFSDTIDTVRPLGNKIGKAFKVDDSRERYIQFLSDTFPENGLRGLTVVVDCANGAAYRTAPAVFRKLGAKVITLSSEPDGSNINDRCGALHPEVMAQTVVDHKADIGIALDGDADRTILCDEHGKPLDGDYILAICGSHYAQHNQLNGGTIVATVMSNIGLESALNKFDVKVIRTDVGDRYVSETMRKVGSNLGGEQSGHIIFAHHFPSGDGTLTALRVLEIMIQTRQPLSDLAQLLKKFPQTLINVAVKEKQDLNKYSVIKQSITQAEQALQDEGRVLVRFSGTRPLVRIMVEGKDKNLIQHLAEHIAASIAKEIGGTSQ